MAGQRTTDTRPVLLTNAHIVDPSQNLDGPGGLLMEDGRIVAVGAGALNNGAPEGAEVIDCQGMVVAPGLVDLCAHVGEPGHEHRETLASAGRAAVAGGITTMVVQPDTEPCIDDPALVNFVQARAQETSAARVRVMAALTKRQEGGELTEFGLLGEAGAVGFTSGRGTVSNAQVLRRALTYGKDFNALICNRPEDQDLKGSGVMNLSEAAVRLGLGGIPSEAETTVLARDLRIARLAGGRYHASLLSTAEAPTLMAWAKDAGIRATSSVSVAHLTLNEIDIGAYRTFFKLSPPLRSEDDRQALVEAVASGTIDIIVSGHDPQDVETKRLPFAEAADGAIGLETFLAAGLRLVHAGDLTLSRLIEAMATRPAALAGLDAGTLKVGSPADVIVVDPEEPWVLTSRDIISRAKNTPYENARFTGRVRRTFVGGVQRYAR
ncbi:dihydroorotase [Oryzibacter oryziterrae]|uniref:dihydroorotase n=1 Tax=Oryzibacter oryziterrae TaxID=2766474 RepID=UPI001F01C71F|nr:dihydroorotase [Oryzibacter oryziterrae]